MNATREILYDIHLYVSDESKLENSYKRILCFLLENKDFFHLNKYEIRFIKFYRNKFIKRVKPTTYYKDLLDGRVTYIINFALNISYKSSLIQIQFCWGEHIKKDMEFMYISNKRFFLTAI